MSKKKWEAGQRSTFHRGTCYRGIVSKAKGRSKQVSAYLACFPYCELGTRINGIYRTQGGLIDRVNPAGWLEYKRVWRGHEDEFTLDPHHVHGRKNGDQVWNLITISRPVHDFFHGGGKPGDGGTRIARLLCLAVKDRKNELFIEEASKVLLRHPLGAVAADLDAGFFEGNCKKLAEQLIKKHEELIRNFDRNQLVYPRSRG